MFYNLYIYLGISIRSTLLKIFLTMKKLTIFLFLALFILSGCKEKRTEVAVFDPGFTDYISGFTSGVISTTSNVILSFVSDLPEEKRNEALTEDLLEIKPSVKGTYAWRDSRTLEFHPELRLEPGKLYQCRFHLDKLMEVPEGLEDLEFQFQTIQQSPSTIAC